MYSRLGEYSKPPNNLTARRCVNDRDSPSLSLCWMIDTRKLDELKHVTSNLEKIDQQIQLTLLDNGVIIVLIVVKQVWRNWYTHQT
jgi:hypothetical protein